jgi:hypothetical protein
MEGQRTVGRRVPATIMILGAGAFIVLELSNNGAAAQPASDISEIDRAAEAYKRGDCQSAWDIVWPVAKKSDAEAHLFLFGTIVDRMIPPGDSGFPRSVFTRTILPLVRTQHWRVPARKGATRLTSGLGLQSQTPSMRSRWVRTGIALLNVINLTLRLRAA